MDWIRIRGAREHNLKNINVQIPKDQLVVITGLSGSGKSTLAFDTVFAEGQRRYVESLSTYARQFLGQLEKPDVDAIDGLSPAIAIDQKGGARNPRSTVGTVTEIYDFLRLLFARIGHPHCPECGRELQRQSAQQMVDAILNLPISSRILLLAPLVQERKGEHEAIIDDVRKRGFVRVRIDGEVRELDEPIKLEKQRAHTIEVVVDRLIIRAQEQTALAEHPDRIRLSDSVETALKLGNGQILVQIVGGEALIFSEQYACPVHGQVNLGSLEPRDFSFNSPHGACPNCGGLGVVQDIDPARVLPDQSLSLAQGAILPWNEVSKANKRYYADLLQSFAEHYAISPDQPLRELPPALIHTLLYGSNGELMTLRYHVGGKERTVEGPFDGVIPSLRRRLSESKDEAEREQLTPYLTPHTCPACGGARLRPEVRAVTVANHTIADITQMTIGSAVEWASLMLSAAKGQLPAPAAPEQPTLSPRESLIATPILTEVHARLRFLGDVGLSYLDLNRSAITLSGGETQRIRLATQVGSGLSGVLYVLDEPSIGLHPRDHDRLLTTLRHLRDLGNSVLVVEHDEETIRAADWVIDIGPGAGEQGGELLASGPLSEILAEPRSITGQFLSGARRIATPPERREGNGKQLELRGCREHNLQNVDLRLPLGTFIAVSGVSGSGKSSLIIDTLYPRLAQLLHNSHEPAGAHDAIYGVEHLDKIIAIDQSPIGRTPRSNPATYTKVFDPIRNLFAATNEAKARGYDASRFSFNVKGGRCENCGGEGLIQVEMQFLPDLFVPCEVCGGARYNRETLDVRFRGKHIAEVLDMTVEEATAFFERVPAIHEKLQTLLDVGLGYIRLGQPGNTLSGGEAQRIKLASELARRATGRTLYILDEPTTGLHFADVERLIAVLQRLVDAGNTVLVIEHNLDMLKSADWLVDLGPEGGSGGGQIIGMGTPEYIATLANSHTGRYLATLLQ